MLEGTTQDVVDEVLAAEPSLLGCRRARPDEGFPALERVAFAAGSCGRCHADHAPPTIQGAFQARLMRLACAGLRFVPGEDSHRGPASLPARARRRGGKLLGRAAVC